MRIEINAKDTHSKLKKLSPFINSSTVLPILTCACIQVCSDYILIHVTDLENSATLKIPAMVTGKAVNSTGEVMETFCIEFSHLLKFLSNCGKDDMATIKTKNRYVYLETGEFEAKELTEDFGNFPKLPVMEEVKSKSVFVQKDFLPIIKNALKFVSHDDLRPAMTGLFFHFIKNKLRVVSTDAHRLFFKNVNPHQEPSKGFIDFIVPFKAMFTVANLPSAEDISMESDGTRVKFVSGDFTIFTRVMDARFPDYTVVLPEIDSYLYVKRKQLATYLKFSQPFTNKSTGQLHCEIDKELIRVLGADVDFSIGCRFTIPAYNEHGIEKYDTSFNLNFLLQAIGCDKDENVKISTMMIPTKPIIIDDCCLIMPLMNIAEFNYEGF